MSTKRTARMCSHPPSQVALLCMMLATLLRPTSIPLAWSEPQFTTWKDEPSTYKKSAYPMVFIATYRDATIRNGGNLGTDVLEAGAPSRGQELWLLNTDGTTQRLFPIPGVHDALVDYPLGLTDGRINGSVTEPSVSINGKRVYFSYCHDALNFPPYCCQSTGHSNFDGWPLGGDLYAINLGPKLDDPAFPVSQLRVSRLTQTVAPYADAMNPAVAQSRERETGGMVYIGAIEVDTEYGRKLVFASNRKQLKNSNANPTKKNKNFNFNPSCGTYYDGTVVSNPARAGLSGGIYLSGYGKSPAAVLPGSTVVLSAAPDSDEILVDNWSGCDSAEGNFCTVTVPATGIKSVSITYKTSYQTLTVSPLGNGSGTDWTGDFFADSTGTLTANADAGSSFTGWSGDCSGLSPSCRLSMDKARNVSASFILGFPLSVSLSGTGSGRVNSGDGAIDCGNSCTSVYDGSTVTLTATPDPGSVFAGWSGGGCSGTAACVVTVDAATTVDAQFDASMPRLTLTTNGPGGIASMPDGGLCSGSCTISYAFGTEVTLNAMPDANAAFAGWSGACSGANPCVLTLDQDLSVGAAFFAAYTLTVTRSGPGTGTVTSAPSGIDCGVNCTAAFAENSSIVLSATPGPGTTFLRWNGAGCSGTDDCTLILSGDVVVDAAFDGYTDPPFVNVQPLPPAPEPNPESEVIGDDRVIARGSNLILLKDYNPTPSPMTAQAQCAMLVTNCVRGDVGSLDSCMMSAPRCTTETPWNESACCANACWDEYRAARIAGTSDLDAMLDVIFGAPSCMPGVDNLVWGYVPIPRQQRNELLDIHNSKRELHCAASLNWSTDLAAAAQQWADQLAANGCQQQHSPQAIAGQYGETIAFASSPSATATEMVTAWYDEVALYDFQNPGFSAETGHFTTVVWKATSEVGCGIAMCGGGQMLVCSYLQPANVVGAFPENVLPEPVPPETCAP